MEIVIVICLILLNGVFAMSEIAVISSRKSKLSAEAKRGNLKAKEALALSKNPDSFLSTVQVGITLIGILTGIYSGDVLAKDFSDFLINMGFPERYSYSVGQVFIIIVVTYVSIIFGELIPKRIGISSPETIAKVIAFPMRILSKVAYPFVWLLSKSTSFIFNLLNIKSENSAITEEEIKSLIRESRKEGGVQLIEQEIVERVFGLGDRTLESIMTYRSEIIYIDINAGSQEIIDIVNSHNYEKYPVVDKSLDNIVGIIYLKDMFGHAHDENFNIRNYIHPVVYFSETMKVYSALEDMKSRNVEQAFVVDEYGGLQGLVTLQDILEALVGEISSSDGGHEIVRRKDGNYLIDGQISFYDFLEYFDREDLYPDAGYSTLSGLILGLLGNIPKVGDTLSWKNFEFEIIDMDGVRIDKVLVNLNHVSE